MSWVTLWKYILIIGVSLYSILLVVVAIGGFKDVLSMLKELSEPEEGNVPQ